MSVDSLESIEVFYSYAQKDESLRKELERHLGALKRLNLIRDWSNQNVPIGANRMQAVDAHINTAHIILLLISADFMDSDYCYSIEMQRALERHKQGKARVIPILLREVYLGDTPIASLRALPTDGVPITSWNNRDEALTNVAKGIVDTIQDFKANFGNKYLNHENRSDLRDNAPTQDPDANKIRGTAVGLRNNQNLTRAVDTNETAKNIVTSSSAIPKGEPFILENVPLLPSSLLPKSAPQMSSPEYLRPPALPPPATDNWQEKLKNMRSLIVLLVLLIIVLVIGSMFFLNLFPLMP